MAGLVVYFLIGAGVCFAVLIFGALRGTVEDANETPESIEKENHIEL